MEEEQELEGDYISAEDEKALFQKNPKKDTILNERSIPSESAKSENTPPGQSPATTTTQPEKLTTLVALLEDTNTALATIKKELATLQHEQLQRELAKNIQKDAKETFVHLSKQGETLLNELFSYQKQMIAKEVRRADIVAISAYITPILLIAFYILLKYT